MNITAD